MRFLERAVESRGRQDTGWTLDIADGRTHPPVKNTSHFINSQISHISHILWSLCHVTIE